MRQYLSTIHTRPHAHKKRFAFLVSSGFTLILFFVWFTVRFSPFTDTPVVAQNGVEPIELATLENNELEPFDNIKSGLAASFEALKQGFQDAKEGVESVNLESEYQKVRTDSLNQMNTPPIDITSGTPIYGN